MPKNQDWKQILSTRNLTVDDMYDMSIDDREKFIQKEAVWKKPDYQKLVDTGTLSRDAAYLLKCVYDAIPAKPADGDRIKQQGQWHEERKNYITFVAGVRDAMKHVRTADDMQKALQTVLIDNGFATKQGVFAAYKQCGARKVAQALLKGPEKVHDEALQKMFCVSEKDQARMYFNYHRFVPENCEFKNINGTPVLAVQSFDGERHYTIPKNTRSIEANAESWKPNSFFLTRNGKVFANNFDTPAAAQEEATKFGLSAVQSAKLRGTNITPSQLPPLYIPEISEQEHTVDEKQLTVEPEEITEPVVEESIFLDDPVIPDVSDVAENPTKPVITPETTDQTPAASVAEEPARPVVEPPEPSIAEEIKQSLQHAINITKPARDFGIDPLKQFGFRNGSFFNELNTEQQQAVLSNVVSAFETLQNTLDLPPEGISFGGNLALTFGKSANQIITSYDIQTDTLNLAKLDAGDDLMAMSWFHALDLAMGEQLGFFAPLSEQPYREVKEVAPEFAKLIKTACITEFPTGRSESNYHTACRDFDASFSDKSRYWQSMPNMLSRAFACYITDKTEMSSVFLSGFSEKAGPVPQGQERAALNKQFEAVIAEAKQFGVFTVEQEHVVEQEITDELKRMSLEELIANAGAPTASSKNATSKNREDR